MADGIIEFKTEINSDDIDKQSKGLLDKLKKIGSSNTAKGIANIGMAFTGIGVAAKTAVSAVKGVVNGVKDLTDAYKVQEKAEVQLQQAARNNPFLDNSAVSQLKAYASELQSISTYGDEQLLPLMSQLASAGRTQEEIMQIMSASVDLAASGMMSLDGAVDALNKTYQGNLGLLGNQISGLKGLNEEELKQGKAVEVVAKSVKGMAEETTKATGSAEQLKNSWGDFKEYIGSGIAAALAPLERGVNAIISKINGAIASSRKLKEELGIADAVGAGNYGAYDSGQVQRSLEIINEQTWNAQAERDSLYRELLSIYEHQKKSDEYIAKRLEDIRNETADIFTDPLKQDYLNLSYIEQAEKDYEAAYQRVIELEKEQANARQALEATRTSEAETKAAAERAKADEEEAARLNELVAQRDALRAQYDETIRQAQAEIAQRRILGEEITKEAEAQELLNKAQSAYVQMMSNPAFAGNSGNYEHEVKAREQIAQWAEEAGLMSEDVIDQWEDLKKAVGDILGDVELSVEEQIEQQKMLLSEMANDLVTEEEDAEGNYIETISNENLPLYEQYCKAMKKLDDELLDAKRANRQKDLDENAEFFKQINDFVSQYGQIANDATALFTQSVKAQQDSELTALSEQYTDGIISYEEYCDKKKEIDKKAAQEQYKLDMFNWTSQLLTATANIAQGVAASLAQGFPIGLISGALVSAAGAIQIASIVANKPQPPKFATGGIVGGNSYKGDKISASVNSGEMILNRAQQKTLFDSINSGSVGGGGVVLQQPITIENHTDASVKTNVSDKNIRIMINDVVNAEMARGTYTGSMNAANSKAQGVSYL